MLTIPQRCAPWSLLAHAPQPAHCTPALRAPLRDSPSHAQAAGRLAHRLHAPTPPYPLRGAATPRHAPPAPCHVISPRTQPAGLGHSPFRRSRLPRHARRAGRRRRYSFGRCHCSYGSLTVRSSIACLRAQRGARARPFRDVRARAGDRRAQPAAGGCAADGQRGRDARTREQDVRRAAT